MHTATALATLTLLSSSALAQTPSLTIINPPADLPTTRSTALSRDGSRLVGYATPPARGFTWTRAGGYFDYTASNGYIGEYAPFGVSADSATVVGAGFASGIRAFRATATGAPQDLGTPWDASFAQGSKQVQGMWTNQTGTRIIASMQRRIGNSPPEISPFVWTQATNSWQPLIPSQQSLSDFVDVNDASDDGTVVVGQVNEGSIFGATRGFVHRADTGYSLLTAPTSNSIGWFATTVNGDGSIIAGVNSLMQGTGSATIWRDGVVQVLSDPEGFNRVFPTDISNDGQMLVGTMNGGGNGSQYGFVWTPTSGTVTLNDYLQSYGLSLPGTYDIVDIHLSGDGRTIGGYYQSTLGDNRAFVFTIPAPSSILLLSAGTLALTRRRR